MTRAAFPWMLCAGQIYNMSSIFRERNSPTGMLATMTPKWSSHAARDKKKVVSQNATTPLIVLF
jgi:hypothetical protein